MKAQDVKALGKRGLTLLRPDADEWEAIAAKRAGGRRFSLHFPHDQARLAKRDGLVLVVTPETDSQLRIGYARSINSTATLDSRVHFDLVHPIEPSSLSQLAEAAKAGEQHISIKRLSLTGPKLEHLSKKLGEAVIEVIARDDANGAALSHILARLRQPATFDDARALQFDAVSLAIQAFGDQANASSVQLPGEATALQSTHLLEDAVIEHDARWIPGWDLIDSDLTGRATFTKRGAKLEVFTANKRPLEKLLGVDLIYLNEQRRSLVMVQYKMLEKQAWVSSKREQENDEEVHEEDWIVRLDDQFKAEIGRMQRFDRDLAPDGEYRLNPGAFFFKMVRRLASLDSPKILLSLGHLNQLIEEGGKLEGPRGGLRISYRGLDGHYMRSGPFVELVRSGYIGTRGATTDHLQTLIKASLGGGKAVVAGIQSALEDVSP